MAFFKETASNSNDVSQPATEPAGPTRNVAVKVLSYDAVASTTTGVDIETGEQITVKLRSLKQTFDKQGGVHNWSKPKGKLSVKAGDDGGVIVFESVIRDSEGALSSRWGVVAAHNADEADVAKVYARPATSFKNSSTLDEKRAIEVARVDQAQLVGNEKELRQAIAEIISRPYTIAVVRAFDGEDLRAANVWRGRENTPDQAVDNFRKTNNFLGRHLSDESIGQMQAVEVFPLERVYAGLDTREMLRDASKLDALRFDRDWSLGEGKGWGFGESLVALRTHEQGGRFFTMMLPAVNRQPLWSLQTLPSPHIQPAVAPSLSCDSGAEKSAEHGAVIAPVAATQVAAGVQTSPATPSLSVVPDTPSPANILSDDVRSSVAEKVASGARMFRR